MTESPVVGIIGATGNLGHALARRWSKNGIKVLVGSRSADSARTAADTLSADVGREVGWGINRDIAQLSDLVVVAVPWAAQADTLQDIKSAVAGKIVVDTTVPLVPPKVIAYSCRPRAAPRCVRSLFSAPGSTWSPHFITSLHTNS